ncbi:MAG: HPP family protein [Spongiibacteraceae bacterium]
MKLQWLGIQSAPSSDEQVIATIGGIISIIAVMAVSYLLLGTEGTIAIVPSMGASTVLLFAVPHGTLSQPWALIAGNLCSAAVGVSCALLIPNTIIAAGTAVGLAIGAMHLCRCIHPPGGATALVAVVGGDSIQQLGYSYLLMPVLVNCFIILIVALIFNNCFAWRRYPLSTMHYHPHPPIGQATPLPIESIQYGLREIGGVVDVAPEELEQIFLAAQRHQQQRTAQLLDVELGGVYSNNRPGNAWAVRQVIDYASHPDPSKALIIYKVLQGAQKNSTDSCTREEFAKWAKQRVRPAAKLPDSK